MTVQFSWMALFVRTSVKLSANVADSTMSLGKQFENIVDQPKNVWIVHAHVLTVAKDRRLLSYFDDGGTIGSGTFQDRICDYQQESSGVWGPMMTTGANTLIM